MSAKALAFRHVPFEHAGRIADSLHSRGVSCEYVDLFRGGLRAGIANADALIFLGGPVSANDDLPYIRQEIDILGEAFSRGIPVLGICLGAQLIAKALGARVYSNPVKELGWYPVEWTEAAALDRLHCGLTAPETVFHWHAETFDLPPRAELLAYSSACRNQAYRVGENVYGLQYHLEVTPEMLTDWFTQDANCGELREIANPIDPYANAAHLRELAGLVFGRWCELLDP